MAKGKYWNLFGAGLATALAASTFAVRAEDAPSAKQLYMTRSCIACHGKDGAKAIQTYPHLAGLDQAYLYAQMKDIADGKRVSGPDARGYPRTQAMKDVMGIVSDDDQKSIAAWLSALPSPPIKPSETANAADGAALYAKSGCVGCHGPNGTKPSNASYPIIAGQKKEYLALQIKEIRDGVRTNGKAKMMAGMVKKLSDTDIDALADYLSQVERTAAK